MGSRESRGTPALLAAAGTGALLCALALVDQGSGRWTAHDVAHHYGRFGLHPDPDVLTTVLAVVSASFAVWMALTALLCTRGRRRTAAASTLAAVLASAGVAALATGAHEFSGFVLTPEWRVLPWLMPVVAAACLGSLRRARTTPRRASS